MSNAVERAIAYIWERYSEPLSLSDIAQSAILSRFHFSRIFREITGISPGRYLSAVRIYQAKRLLLGTSMNVTDISFAVGYNSLGSFTNHFTDSVGVPPGRFRRLRNGHRPWADSPPDPPQHGGTVAGAITLPENYAAARMYVGAFDTPIVQRRPKSATVVEIAAPARSSTYRLTGVPEGVWFVHAVAVADSADPEPWTRRGLLVGGRPVTVAAAEAVDAAVSLRPRCATDLPILLALPDLEAETEIFAPREAQPQPA